jgi:hypothetical protein
MLFPDNATFSSFFILLVIFSDSPHDFIAYIPLGTSDLHPHVGPVPSLILVFFCWLWPAGAVKLCWRSVQKPVGFAQFFYR